MMNRLIRRAVSSLLAFMTLAPGLHLLRAQTPGATIRGTVLDSSDSPVPGVALNLRNEGTGYARNAVTDGFGNYEFPFIDLGGYALTAEKAGFKKYSDRGISLGSRETKRIDITLEVGEVISQIDVTGEAPVINTETPEITRTMNSRDIDYFSASVIGGDGPGRLMSGTAPGSGVAQLSFYGSRHNQTKFLMNGVETNFYSLYMPTDSVAEVKLFAINAPAEYPAPNALSMNTRGGSNEVHGLAGLTYRNNALNALPASSPPGAPRPPGTPRETYHAALAGPVYLPKLYNGSDRTFFHFTIEGDPPTTARGPFTNTVPTQAMKQGDLSILNKTIRDPQTGLPFANALIPAGRISPVSQKMLALYPDPNSGTPNVVSNNLAQVYAAPDNYRKYVVRFDQKLGAKDTLTGFWTGWKTDSSYPVATGGAGVGGILSYGRNNSDGLNQQWAVSDTHIFSPKVINEARFGWFRTAAHSFDDTLLQNRLQQFGLQGVTSINQLGGPQVTIVGYAGLRTNGESNTVNNRIHLLDNVSIRVGRHTLKSGVEVRRFQINQLQAPADTAGRFIFDGSYTGDPFGDFLLGIPQSAVRTTPRPELRGRYAEWGAFVQDEFVVSRKLTLQLGLRYGLTTVTRDENGLYFNFDTKTGGLVVPDERALRAVQRAWPASVPVLTTSQAGFPTNLRQGNHHDFQPRIGFAYRPFANGGTVFRAGYGIFLFPLSFAVLQTGGPFALTETFLNSITNGQPLFAFPAPFPTSPGNVPKPSATAITPDFRTPYKQQWNFTVERELISSTGLRVSYIGTKDTALGYGRQLNRLPPSTTPFNLARVPYPALVDVIGIENGANDSYNALDVEVNRVMAQGLQFKSGWTWAKSIGDIPMSRFENEFGSQIEDPFNRSRDRGNGEYVPRHKWVTEFVYDLPVGKSRRFLNSVPGGRGAVLNQVLGGWTVSSTIALHSAIFFTPTFSGRDPSNTGTSGGRPDVVPGCDPNAGSRTRTQWFNVSCFAVPPVNAGRFGTAGRTNLKGPAAFGMDVSVFKRFPLRERVAIRFEATATDMLNHPTFGIPVANISAPNAGALTSIASGQGIFQGVPVRRIYFDMRFEF